MSIVAQSPPAVSIREAASLAWARHQAEVAEQRRQAQEHARSRFRADVHRALRLLINGPSDPFSPLTEADVQAASVELVETAEGIPFKAVVTFANERFNYHPTPNSGGQALYHVYTCPECGAQQESGLSIGSLADLGYWLEEAPKRCFHGGVSR